MSKGKRPPASPGKFFLRGKGQKGKGKTMSCILMNENRIAALARTIINTHKGYLLVGEEGEEYGMARLADAMLAMNIDAFRQRYGMRTLLVENLDDIDLNVKSWRPFEAMSLIPTFKSLQFFLYQCSEGDVDERPLYKTLRAIQNLMAPLINTDSEEYTAAWWG
jgi:hypothetical protein